MLCSPPRELLVPFCWIKGGERKCEEKFLSLSTLPEEAKVVTTQGGEKSWEEDQVRKGTTPW